jgi:hypothetical protein
MGWETQPLDLRLRIGGAGVHQCLDPTLLSHSQAAYRGPDLSMAGLVKLCSRQRLHFTPRPAELQDF